MPNCEIWPNDQIQATLCKHCVNVGAQHCTWLSSEYNDSYIKKVDLDMRFSNICNINNILYIEMITKKNSEDHYMSRYLSL